MSIRHLKALIAVADHGTFAAAADAIGLTQSAISMNMRALEDELRTPLFDRARRPAVLNSQGRALLGRARDIVFLYDQLAETLGEDGQIAGELQLGAVPTTLTGIVPGALAALKQAHPAVRVNLVSGMSGELLNRVERAELDAAIISQPDVVPGGLDWRAVAREDLVVIAPPEATGQDDGTVLRAWPYIRYNRRAWVARTIQQTLEQRGIKVRQSMELDSLESIILMVHYGLGVSIIPDRCVKPPYPVPLATIPFGERARHRVIGLVHPAKTPKARLMESLHQVLLSLCDQEDDVNPS